MDDTQRRELLRIARSAIETELSERLGKTEIAQLSGLTPAENQSGAFVTLRRDKRLRGCMGTFAPEGTLGQTVDRVARLACRDPRFETQPVTLGELPRLTIEVSVLGPLEHTTDPGSLRVGTDGVLVRRGEASGCFLPHVATETGWDAEEFLNKCCSMKAGLPEDAWRQPGTDVYLFTADMFGEAGAEP